MEEYSSIVRAGSTARNAAANWRAGRRMVGCWSSSSPRATTFCTVSEKPGLAASMLWRHASLDAANAHSGMSSANPRPAPSRIRARSNDKSGIDSLWAKISQVSRWSSVRQSASGCENSGAMPRKRYVNLEPRMCFSKYQRWWGSSFKRSAARRHSDEILVTSPFFISNSDIVNYFFPNNSTIYLSILFIFGS